MAKVTFGNSVPHRPLRLKIHEVVKRLALKSLRGERVGLRQRCCPFAGIGVHSKQANHAFGFELEAALGQGQSLLKRLGFLGAAPAHLRHHLVCRNLPWEGDPHCSTWAMGR